MIFIWKLIPIRMGTGSGFTSLFVICCLEPFDSIFIDLKRNSRFFKEEWNPMSGAWNQEKGGFQVQEKLHIEHKSIRLSIKIQMIRPLTIYHLSTNLNMLKMKYIFQLEYHILLAIWTKDCFNCSISQIHRSKYLYKILEKHYVVKIFNC